MSFLKKHAGEIKKFIKFGITGACNTLVDYFIFWLLSGLLGWNMFLAQSCGYAAGTLNSYLINRKWTFATKRNFFSSELFKFIISNLIVLALSMIPLKICVDVFGWGKLFAKLATTAFTLVLNFVFSRLWVFR